MKNIKYLLLLISISLASLTMASDTDQLQHGRNYSNTSAANLTEYFVSEKLDGFRGYWDGKTLRSKSGKRYNPPHWFIEGLGKEPLDGELWLGRQTFEQLAGILNTVDNDTGWKNIHYMIFDMPSLNKPFSERVTYMQNYIPKLDNQFVQIIPQKRIIDQSELDAMLKEITDAGGEGLMLHHQDALYGKGRVGHLLKVKAYEEDDAVIIGYNEGKGKYKGMTGSLQVKMTDGRVFNIGSGLTDDLRRNPPEIGTTINFIYNGLTINNIPRFARFNRIKDKEYE